MADFSLPLKSDWTDDVRLERTLRAIENLSPLDSLTLEEDTLNAAVKAAETAHMRFADVLQLIQETFGKRILVSLVNSKKAKIQLASLGGCCGVCGGEGFE